MAGEAFGGIVVSFLLFPICGGFLSVFLYVRGALVCGQS